MCALVARETGMPSIRLLHTAGILLGRHTTATGYVPHAVLCGPVPYYGSTTSSSSTLRYDNVTGFIPLSQPVVAAPFAISLIPCVPLPSSPPRSTTFPRLSSLCLRATRRCWCQSRRAPRRRTSPTWPTCMSDARRHEPRHCRASMKSGCSHSSRHGPRHSSTRPRPKQRHETEEGGADAAHHHDGPSRVETHAGSRVRQLMQLL